MHKLTRFSRWHIGSYIALISSPVHAELWAFQASVVTKGLYPVGGQEDRLNRNGGRAVLAVAYAPDSKTVVTGGLTMAWVMLWDVSSGKLLHNLKGHTSYVSRVAYAPGWHDHPFW